MPVKKPLLSAPVKVRSIDSWHRKIFKSADEIEASLAIDKMLEAGVRVNQKGKDGQSALMVCAKRRFSGAVYNLLVRGARVDALDDDGRTALMFAVYSGCSATVKVLLEQGADVERLDRYAQGTYDRLCEDDRATKKLLDLYKSLKVPRVKNAGLACHVMTSWLGKFWNAKTELNALSVLKAMVKAGAHPNDKDEHGFSVLMMSAMKGYMDCMQSVISSGADINLQSDAGSTALMLACRADQMGAVRGLMKAGADAEIVDVDGNNLMHYASDARDDILATLFDLGVSTKLVHQKQSRGVSAREMLLDQEDYVGSGKRVGHSQKKKMLQVYEEKEELQLDVGSTSECAGVVQPVARPASKRL